VDLPQGGGGQPAGEPVKPLIHVVCT
jgi:hypothetical protein